MWPYIGRDRSNRKFYFSATFMYHYSIYTYWVPHKGDALHNLTSRVSSPVKPTVKYQMTGVIDMRRDEKTTKYVQVVSQTNESSLAEVVEKVQHSLSSSPEDRWELRDVLLIRNENRKKTPSSVSPVSWKQQNHIKYTKENSGYYRLCF